MKKEATFDLSGPETDSHGNVIGDSGPIVAILDDPNKEMSTTTYKKQKLPESYKALEKTGFKFTSYEER